MIADSPVDPGKFLAGYQASIAGSNPAFPQSGGLMAAGSLTHAAGSTPLYSPFAGVESGSPAQFRINEEGLTGRTKDTELNKLLFNGVNSPDDVTALQIQLIKAGYLNPKSRTFNPGIANPGDATFYAFDKLLNNSIDQKTDYLSLLAKQVDNNPDSRNYKYFVSKFGADGSGDGIKQIHTSTVNLSTPLAAQTILRQTYQQFEGRDPNTAEVSAFTSALMQAQRANPSVTDGTYDPSLGIRGDRNSVTTGGFSSDAAAAFAQNYATTGANQAEANTHAIHGYAAQLESILKGGG